jgi:hypothetical protein
MSMVAGPLPDWRVHVRVKGKPCARELVRKGSQISARYAAVFHRSSRSARADADT